jgi:YHS domain-containing protein
MRPGSSGSADDVNPFKDVSERDADRRHTPYTGLKLDAKQELGPLPVPPLPADPIEPGSQKPDAAPGPAADTAAGSGPVPAPPAEMKPGTDIESAAPADKAAAQPIPLPPSANHPAPSAPAADATPPGALVPHEGGEPAPLPGAANAAEHPVGPVEALPGAPAEPADQPATGLPSGPGPLPASKQASPISEQCPDPAAKLKRLGERLGRKGMKGFCPVVLREQRDLVDGRSAYKSTFESQTYLLASQEAKAIFDSNPEKYAPVAGGLDLVVKINSDQLVEGTLDFAAWYRDRLYLFSSPESLEAFSIDPQAYVGPLQRAAR